jgi:hypothetical protein
MGLFLLGTSENNRKASKIATDSGEAPAVEDGEHPDFNSWIGRGARQLVTDSPVAASQIEEMNLEALQAEYARLSTLTDPFGDSKDGFLQEIARTAAANFPWSMAIAEEAMASGEPPIGIWSALLQGLSSAHEPEEWTSLLLILACSEHHLDSSQLHCIDLE